LWQVVAEELAINDSQKEKCKAFCLCESLRDLGTVTCSADSKITATKARKQAANPGEELEVHAL